MTSNHYFIVRIISLFFWLLLSLSQACSSQEDIDGEKADAGADEEALSEMLFDPDHLIEVEIEMDPDDWDTIRFERRTLVEVMSNCPEPFEYTYLNATVTVDGETYQDVAIRKKGYLGSLSPVRPSLKLNFRRNVEGRTAWGMRRMTLNNDKQDRSHTHQCMAYQLFRTAGGTAPRCNFAHVTVNGSDLGIYSHVESIKKPFLARHFKDDDGNLYEGQIADFHPDMVSSFQVKTNKNENDMSDLKKVVNAMEVDDDQLFESLEEVFDMDAFLTHWAMEVITGHWDSYSGDQNNFYTYHDPTTDKFYFIPWGADGAFSTDHSFLPPDIPISVYAWSWPTYRLYGHPDSRAKYRQRLVELLDEIWDKDRLLAEVDRIQELTGAPEGPIETQREYIRNRKQQILDELESDEVDWTYTPKRIPHGELCLPTFNIRGEFDTTWGSLEASASSDQSYFTVEETPNSEIDPDAALLDFHVEEIRQPFSTMLVSANDDLEAAPGTPHILMIGVPESGGPMLLLLLVFEPSMSGEKELAFSTADTAGVVARLNETGDVGTLLGSIGDIKVVFEEEGTNDGDPIKGSFEGVFVPMVFDQFNQL